MRRRSKSNRRRSINTDSVKDKVDEWVQVPVIYSHFELLKWVKKSKLNTTQKNYLQLNNNNNNNNETSS